MGVWATASASCRCDPGTGQRPPKQRNQGGRATGRRHGPMTLERDPEAGACAILTIRLSAEQSKRKPTLTAAACLLLRRSGTSAVRRSLLLSRSRSSLAERTSPAHASALDDLGQSGC